MPATRSEHDLVAVPASESTICLYLAFCSERRGERQHSTAVETVPGTDRSFDSSGRDTVENAGAGSVAVRAIGATTYDPRSRAAHSTDLGS